MAFDFKTCLNMYFISVANSLSDKIYNNVAFKKEILRDFFDSVITFKPLFSVISDDPSTKEEKNDFFTF